MKERSKKRKRGASQREEGSTGERICAAASSNSKPLLLTHLKIQNSSPKVPFSISSQTLLDLGIFFFFLGATIFGFK